VITSARSSEQPQVDNSNFEEISDVLEEEAPLQALPRKYINDMVKDVFDHKYGVRYDASSQSFKVGNSKLSILNNDLIIQNKHLKAPNDYTSYYLKKLPLIILKRISNTMKKLF
jgi:conjugal transfer/entry exclusion protein